MKLKTELRELDFTAVSEMANLDFFIESMLDNIGSTDPELRDTLIYSTLGKLIMEDYLTESQMTRIMEVCLGKLFFGIGEIEGDLVFTRSFSALIIGAILEKDRQRSFLQEEIVLDALAKSIEYLHHEKDIRGHVEGKGWAHSVAHGADLVAEAVKHPRFSSELNLKCLSIVKECLFKESSTKTPFVDDEEERLIFVLEALIEKGLTDSEIELWIAGISDSLEALHIKEEFSLNFFWKRSNVVAFLRGFYFRLLHKNEKAALRNEIVEVLQQLRGKLYW